MISKKTLYSLLGVAVLSMSAMTANAALIDVTVDGIESFDAPGAVANTIVTVDIAAALGLTSGSAVILDGIGWDVTITAEGASWYSETAVSFSDSSGGQTVTRVPGSVDAFADPGVAIAYTSGGVEFLSTLGETELLLSDGLLRLEFFETFDDVTGVSDATWGGNLTVSAIVPVPPAFVLLFSGLLSAGVLGRRRI